MAPGMLPTPAKTPRKRALHSEESLQPTARVLFPSRPATIDEVTPRKARRTIKNAYSLESFEQDGESSKISIFTDSKERVPTADESEENPFVTKKGKGKSKSKGKAKATPQKSRKLDLRSQQMEEAVNHDEGMVYLFRGKKMFRKFVDDRSDAPTEGEDSGDDRQLKRQIGHEASRPLTRSSVKPRLLFKEEIKQRKLENGEVSDEEEAVTDVELSVATPSRKKGKMVMQIAESMQEATPPPTVRKAKREISFDSWTRVKSAHSSGSSSRGAKRSGSPLVREVDKKARSEHSAASSLSTDSL
ncbi:hypothetical protein N0V94_002214 [Neodidymelliopsis sp. IMI 364377]|nr:hypothetical protein N0V94_002214 [Neodidymelliopsis sp. IMI 364377]